MSSPNSILGNVPFLRFTIAIAFGILISRFFDFTSQFYLLAILVCFLTLMVISWETKKRNPFRFHFGIITVLIFTLFGFIYSSVYNSNIFDDSLPTKALYYGRVEDKAPAKNDRFKYIVKLCSAFCNDTTIAVDENIILFNADSLSNKNIQLGTYLYFHARLYEIKNSNNPGGFNYQNFMLNKGIRYQCYINKSPAICDKKSKSLKNIALNFRIHLLNLFQKSGIKHDEFAVLSALTLGDKNYLSKELKNSFSSSGAMHILAVSGLHVGIIYYIIKFIFSFLFKRKQSKVINIALFISLLWAYAFITGLSPSVLRSCTMFSFIIVGEQIKRKTNIYNTIFLSAFVLMLINPNIIYQVGFQLSYSAVLSIIFFQPKLAKTVKVENKLVKYFWLLFTVSIAAQIGTFPLAIYYFHQFPVYFWLSNFIVIPFAGIIICTTFLFFILSIFQPIGLFVAKALIIILKTLNISIKYIEQLPFSVVDNIWIDNITFLIILLSIPILSIVISVKQKRLIISTLVILILIVFDAILISIKTQQQNFIIFYNSYSDPLISFINGNNHYYYSTSNSIKNSTENLLISTSGKYHTLNAINSNLENKKSANIVFKENFIFYQDIAIQLAKENISEKPNNALTDIIWNPNKKDVGINNWNKVTTSLLKRGKLVHINKTRSSFNTNIDGAIILKIRNKRVNSH